MRGIARLRALGRNEKECALLFATPDGNSGGSERPRFIHE
jgi:hypothetical protein